MSETETQSPASGATGEEAAVDEKPSRFREALHEFRVGATRPSLLALGLAVHIGVIPILLCFAFIDRDLMTGEKYEYFTTSAADDHIHRTHTLLQLSEQPELSGPALFILGTSAIQEGLVSQPDVRSMLSERVGIEMEVYNLASPSQSGPEMLAVVDFLPERFDGVILLGVAPQQFRNPGAEWGNAIHEPKFGFVSSAVDEVAARRGIKIPRRTGNYFWDNRYFFLPRLPFVLINSAFGAPESAEHDFIDYSRPGPEAVMQFQRRVSKERLKGFDEKLEASLTPWARIYERARERGDVEIVLVESPRNPRIVREVYGEALFNRYGERLRREDEEHGVQYWDVNPEVGFTRREFYDWVHVLDRDAQRRYTAALLDRVAELWRERRAERESE